jgi:hypothetical protein
MNRELLVRDFLLYIAGILGVFGAGILETSFWYGIVAIALSVIVFLIRVGLKAKGYPVKTESK